MTLYPSYLMVSSRRYRQELPGALPSAMNFIRVLHQCELPETLRHVPPRMPSVAPFHPNHFSNFGKNWQLLSWKLNPKLTAANMSAVYHNALWISNGSGFGDDGDPRANYFTNSNLGYPPPKVEALTCGGNLLRVLGEKTIQMAGKPVGCYIVDTLDYRNPPATIDQIPPWLITHAVKLDTDGNPTNFQQGYSHLGYAPGVRHPLVADPARFEIVIEKWRCVRWLQSEPPEPLRVYMRVS